MIEIDGSEGGGQMLRTALSLSAVTGKEFKIENIRGDRSEPGLKNQHLKAVEAVKRLCSAETENLCEGSNEITFKPKKLKAQPFTVNIGTAGSVTLLLDAVWPLTTKFKDNFRMDVKGGTDVKWSPTSLCHKQVKLPLLRKTGFEGYFRVKKTGFYPRGGGEVRFESKECSFEKVEFEERGSLQGFEVYSKASKDLESADVADRQANKAAKLLKKEFVGVEVEKEAEYVNAASTGSALLIKAVYQNSIVGFDKLGEKGKRSEKVAAEAVEQFMRFHETDAAVDECMADQLMVFMSISGGKIRVPKISSHIRTNKRVLEAFGAECSLNERDNSVLLSIQPID